ncbi:MAG TPA: hypothetical protein VIH99_05005 [Bdellovibrionota bacterium]
MKTRFFLISSCLFLLVAAISLVQAEEAKKEETKQEEAAPADGVKKAVDEASKESAAPKSGAKKTTPVALTMEAIQELEERKTALDSREKQLDERGRDYEIQEKLLKEKLRKMEDLNKRMAERLDSFKKDHEQRIAKLVTVVEGMKPEMAARYVENLDANLAVEILARIKEQKASKILNLVDKKMGAKLTELYTGYRDSLEEPPPAPAATPPSAANATNGKEDPNTKKPM